MNRHMDVYCARSTIALPCAAALALAGCAIDAGTAADEAALGSAESAVTCSGDHSRITVRRGVHEIQTPALNADRPELSPDGRRLVYTVEEITPLPFFVLSVHEVTAQRHGQWSPERLVEQGIPAVISGSVNSWFFPTFRPNTSGLLVGLGTIQTDENGIPIFPTLRASFVDIAESGQVTDTVMSALDVGLPFGEIPEGERYSPSGQQVTFFAQQSPDDQGIYVYDIPTSTLSRLTTELDKDPTFSADGRTIFFHHQDGNAQNGIAETDTLGTLRLQASGGQVTATRALIQPAPGLFAVEQHPTPIVGSDAVWFHVQDSADSASSLAVRRTCAPGRVTIDFEVGGRRIVDAKRPGSALHTRDVTFMGKFDGDVNYRIFAIDDEIVDVVTTLAQLTPCPRSAP
jgi:WD40 repeat protein